MLCEYARAILVKSRFTASGLCYLLGSTGPNEPTYLSWDTEDQPISIDTAKNLTRSAGSGRHRLKTSSLLAVIAQVHVHEWELDQAFRTEDRLGDLWPLRSRRFFYVGLACTSFFQLSLT